MVQEIEKSFSKILYLFHQVFSPFEGLGTGWGWGKPVGLAGSFLFSSSCLSHVSAGTTNEELTVNCWWWVGGRRPWGREKVQGGRQVENIPQCHTAAPVRGAGAEKDGGARALAVIGGFSEGE